MGGLCDCLRHVRRLPLRLVRRHEPRHRGDVRPGAPHIRLWHTHLCQRIRCSYRSPYCWLAGGLHRDQGECLLSVCCASLHISCHLCGSLAGSEGQGEAGKHKLVSPIVVHYITNHVLFGTLDLMGTGVGEDDVDGGMMEFLELLCICVILGLAYLGLSLAGCSCNGVRAAVARCCKGCERLFFGY